ncbi:unnamed protein product [Porites lobata]|uniref:Uncharacterized protein n=1 Tax=Porites lobata TaxID=104759 RepID=A0ABN8QEI4_9CNID|nr:unnamed protein product [Porites lobata]
MDSSPADPEDPPPPRLPPPCKRKWSLDYERENEDELDPRMLSEALLCGHLVESTWYGGFVSNDYCSLGVVKRNIFIFSSTSTELFFVYLIPDQLEQRGNRSTQRKTSQSKRENQQQTQPTYLNLGHTGGRSDCVRPSVSIVTGDSLCFTITVYYCNKY